MKVLMFGWEFLPKYMVVLVASYGITKGIKFAG